MTLELLHRPAHNSVRVVGGFWQEQLDKIHGVTTWDVLKKFQQDGSEGLMKNYEWVIAGEAGKHIGPPWYDGLICEVLRGISDSIAHKYDPELDETIERYAQIIAKAQDKDPTGYINTYGTLICPNNRWGENGGSLIWQHEIYNLGCLIEAGVHYYRATGKTILLSCAVKAANCMVGVMGPAPRKNIVPSHSLPEEAVLKLYRLFVDEPALVNTIGTDYGVPVVPEEYRALVVFWMDHRGVHHHRASFPHYMGEYAQDHRPVGEQSEAVGHAVRAALMYTGLAAAGLEAERQDFLDAAQRIWHNVVSTKLHISGGIGAVHNEERFGFQYDLPNNAYLETCAGVALAFWAGEMHRAFGEATYFDVFEQALYNNVLPGLSVSGTEYFYENPLISDGTLERWSWHGCPCCPPMFLKLMGSLPDYIYSTAPAGIYVNMHIGSQLSTEIGGTPVVMRQTNCELPWNGENTIVVEPAAPAQFTVAVRIPAWSGAITFTVAGHTVQPEIAQGYALFTREWTTGDSIQVSMELPAVRMEAHPYVKADTGRVALQRGPLLYCVEEIDNPSVDFTVGTGALTTQKTELLGGAVIIKGSTAEDTPFIAVPYYLWNNRGKGKMAVWLRQQGLPQPEPKDDEMDAYAAHSVALSQHLPEVESWGDALYRVYTP